MLLTYSRLAFSRLAFKRAPAIGDENAHVGWSEGHNVEDAGRFQLLCGDRDPDRDEGTLD
jgi:hypothetical protein